MPTRYLKPGIRDSETIDRASPEAENLYYRLLVTVDDFGRFDGRALMVKSGCYPVKRGMTEERIEQLLLELHEIKLLQLYDHDGKRYLQIAKWDNKPRAQASKYPAPEDGCIHLHTDAKQLHADVPLTETGTETVTGVNPAPSGKPDSAGKRGMRVDAWFKTEGREARWKEMREYCESKRPDLDPLETLERFRDYYIAVPGQKGVKLDWMATWRNWCRNEKPGGNAKTSTKSNRDPAQEAWELVLSYIGKVPRGEYPLELKEKNPKAYEALYKAGSWMELAGMLPNKQQFEFRPRFMEAWHAL